MPLLVVRSSQGSEVSMWDWLLQPAYQSIFGQDTEALAAPDAQIGVCLFTTMSPWFSANISIIKKICIALVKKYPHLAVGIHSSLCLHGNTIVIEILAPDLQHSLGSPGCFPVPFHFPLLLLLRFNNLASTSCLPQHNTHSDNDANNKIKQINKTKRLIRWAYRELNVLLLENAVDCDLLLAVWVQSQLEAKCTWANVIHSFLARLWDYSGWVSIYLFFSPVPEAPLPSRQGRQLLEV